MDLTPSYTGSPEDSLFVELSTPNPFKGEIWAHDDGGVGLGVIPPVVPSLSTSAFSKSHVPKSMLVQDGHCALATPIKRK